MRRAERRPAHSLPIRQIYANIKSMFNPRYPNSEVTEELIDLRDEALVQSHWLGSRFKLGALAVGRSEAMWRTEDNGLADLVLSGVIYKGVRIGLRNYSTFLRIWSSIKDVRIGHIIEFKMDLDDLQTIDVHETSIDNGGFVMGMAKFQLAKPYELRSGLSAPSQDQLDLLMSEMYRGASGEYALKPAAI